MNPSYRRDKDHNYMVLDAPEKLGGTEYQVRMLTGNTIPHLLKCHMRMIDGKAVFFYEITGMQPLFRIFEKMAMNQEDIQNVLSGIKEALENTERYLLDGNQLLFEPEYLFMDMQSREVSMCCLPFYHGDMGKDFRKLAEYFLKRLDHSDEAAVLFGYDVYSRTAEENYCLSEVLQIVYQNPDRLREKPKEEPEEKELEREILTEKKMAEKAIPEIIDTEDFYEETVCAEKLSEEQAYVKISDQKESAAKKEKAKIFRKKHWILIILGGLLAAGGILALVGIGILSTMQAAGILFLAIGISIYTVFVETQSQKKKEVEPVPEEAATCIIREGQSNGMAVLVSTRPEQYENILLYREETHVGKEVRKADVCINNDTVSRIHAKIIRREEKYYLTDLNSTNGTWLNGKRIAPSEAVELEEGDLTAFAEAEYIFKKP